MKGRTRNAPTACGAPPALCSCPRETRDFRPAGAFAPGANFDKDYQGNAYALSEGKRLFQAFNCNGCHEHGGGGMGPALMDDKWLYGHEPGDIFTSIAEGRPDGMPAFKGKVPPYQIWQM